MITRNGRNVLDDLHENVPRGADDDCGSFSDDGESDSDEEFVDETNPFGAVDPEAAASADAEDVQPDAAPVVDLSTTTLKELLAPLSEAVFVRAARGRLALATSLLGVVTAADAYAATRTPPRGGQHGGAWRQDTDPRRYFLVETVKNSACSIASAVGYLKHGGEHSTRALRNLVVDAFASWPMLAGKKIALAAPPPHNLPTAAAGYAAFDLAVAVEKAVDGVTVIEGLVYHDEPIKKPSSKARPAERRAFYSDRRPSFLLHELQALPEGSIVAFIDVYANTYAKIDSLFEAADALIQKHGLKLTVVSFVVGQGIPSGSPADDVKPEIFQALDKAARLDLHEHGLAAAAGTYSHTCYGVSDAALESEQLPVVYGGSAASRTTTPAALIQAFYEACKSRRAASIANTAKPLLQARATQHTRDLVKRKKSPAFLEMWDHLLQAHGPDICVSVAMKEHLIVFNKKHETKEELARRYGLLNEDALIRVLARLDTSARRRPFHSIVDRESSPSTQAARCAQRTSRRPRPLLSAGTSRTQTCPAILWCRMGTRSRTRRRASISAARPSPRGLSRSRRCARVEDRNTPYASGK